MIANWPAALGGGILIGLASTLLLWTCGRIAGISGIVDGVLRPRAGDTLWRVAFLAGLIAAAGAYMLLVPGAPQPRTDFPHGPLVVAGLLVGFGTRLGNGCTSGHGVCGLGRLSPRSIAAVLTFVVAAMATTYIVRHVAP